MSLNSSIIANICGKDIQDVKFETECRDSLFTNPTFDFYFKVAVPKARKDRIILERDMLGRIIHSQPPGPPVI